MSVRKNQSKFQNTAFLLVGIKIDFYELTWQKILVLNIAETFKYGTTQFLISDSKPNCTMGGTNQEVYIWTSIYSTVQYNGAAGQLQIVGNHLLFIRIAAWPRKHAYESSIKDVGKLEGGRGQFSLKFPDGQK